MANTNDLDITIKDVEEFFNTMGFTWEHSYFNDKLQKFVKAQTFKEIISFPHLTTFILYCNRHKDEYYVDFYVSPTKFIRYREESNVMGSGSTVYADKDYSAQWAEFINKRQRIQNIDATNIQAK